MEEVKVTADSPRKGRARKGRRSDPSLYKFVEMNVWEVQPRYESSDPPIYQLRTLSEDPGIDLPTPGLPSPRGLRGKLLMMLTGQLLSSKDLWKLNVMGEKTVEVYEIVSVFRLRAMRMLDPDDIGRVLQTLDNTYVWRFSGQESLYRGTVTIENLVNGCFVECFTIGD